MNYFPFHIGDYLSATRHLSWEEDAAYRRLLDTYYTTEKPLPVELRAVCRLVLAITESQKEAVQVVLDEFFMSTPSGWINSRADAEIESMRDKQVVNETRDAHEKERMRRHRERRAEMFAGLREAGIVPAWDVAIKELQRLFDTHCSAADATPATHLQREQVIADATPATAIPTPTPTPTPIKEGEKIKRVTAPPPPTIPGVPESLLTDWGKVRAAKKAGPITATAVEGIRREAEKAGLTMAQAIAACCEAGWVGFKAEWYENREAVKPVFAASGPKTLPPSAESFRERDSRQAAEKMARWAPGIATKSIAAPFDFMDLEAENVVAIESH